MKFTVYFQFFCILFFSFQLYYFQFLINIAAIPPKDTLSKEVTDKYDIKLSNIDDEYLQHNKNGIKTVEDVVFENNQRIENQVSTLKNFLEIDEIYPLTSSHLWEKIYNYIIEHLHEFLENNQLSFKMYIRYNFCLYVIPLLPTEYFLVFPSFYKYIIPYKYRSTKLVLGIIDRIDKFLEEIKKRETKEILTVFYIKRSGSVKDDLEMIKLMPVLIRNDPIRILRWIVDFKAEIV